MEILNANENGDLARCGHFYIRGYVAEVRKKDRKRSWPFATANGSNNLEEQGHGLPPLDVTEFKWWGCQNCVTSLIGEAVTGEISKRSNDSHGSISLSQEIDATSSLGDARDDFEPSSHSRENARRTSDGEAQMQLSVSPLASREDIFEVKIDGLATTRLKNGAAETEEITHHCNNAHEPISHSQGNAAMSSHGYAHNSLTTVLSHSNENTPMSSGDVSMQLSGPPKASRKKISEERNDDLCAILNHNDNAQGHPSVGNDMEEIEPAIEQPTREDSCPFEDQGRGDAEENMDQTVKKTIGSATHDKPCPTKRATNAFDKSMPRFNRNVHVCSSYFRAADGLDKSVSHDEMSSETVSHNAKSGKRKLKKMSSSLGKKKTSSCLKSINVDIDESCEEFSENEHDNNSGTSCKRKVRKIRTLKDILSSSVVCSKILVSSEDPNSDEANIEIVQPEEVREIIPEIDLNLYLSSATTQGINEKVSLGEKRKRNIVQDGEECPISKNDDMFISSNEKNKGKRNIVQDEEDAPLYKNDNMLTLSNEKNKLPRVEVGRSAFLPWKEGSGFQIADTVLQIGRGNVAQAEGWSPQFHQPEAACFPRVSTDRVYEPEASDEMEVVALLAKNRHDRLLSYAEGTNRNSSDPYVTQPTTVFPTLTLSPPNYMPLGSDNPQRFVTGSSNVNSPSQPLKLPPEILMRRAREFEYHQKQGGQFGLLANDSIPATDLLRLMDAGVGTSTSVNVNKRQNFAEQPLLHCGHQLPQLPGLEFRLSTNSEASEPLNPWGFLNRIASTQTHSQKTDTGLSDEMFFDAFKSKKPFRPRPRKSRLEKHLSGNASSSGRLKKGKSEMCTMNRNPADFSVPERGNKYMIGSKELSRNKAVFAGDKRQRMVKSMEFSIIEGI